MADDLSRRLASLRRPSDSRAQADAPSTSSIGETDPFNEPRARAGSQGTVAGRNTARGDDDEADALTDTESSRSSAADLRARLAALEPPGLRDHLAPESTVPISVKNTGMLKEHLDLPTQVLGEDAAATWSSSRSGDGRSSSPGFLDAVSPIEVSFMGPPSPPRDRDQEDALMARLADELSVERRVEARTARSGTPARQAAGGAAIQDSPLGPPPTALDPRQLRRASSSESDSTSETTGSSSSGASG